MAGQIVDPAACHAGVLREPFERHERIQAAEAARGDDGRLVGGRHQDEDVG